MFKKSKIGFRRRTKKRHPGFSRKEVSVAVEEYLAQGRVITDLNKIPLTSVDCNKNEADDFSFNPVGVSYQAIHDNYL